jgi:hypothetical protein
MLGVMHQVVLNMLILIYLLFDDEVPEVNHLILFDEDDDEVF